jgi:hypothetical protein
MCPRFVGGDEHAAWPLEDQAVFLAGKTHRRRVDDRLDFVDVADHAEKQRLVAVMQRIERDVLLEIGRQGAQVGQHAIGLRLHGARKAANSPRRPELVTLAGGKRRALAEQGIAKQGHAVQQGDVLKRRRLFAGLVRLVHAFPHAILRDDNDHHTRSRRKAR